MNTNTSRRERGMGSLRVRGTTWWCRYYHAGKLIEESTGTDDEHKARRILRDKVKRADTPLFIEPSARRLTFEDLAELVRTDATRRVTGQRRDSAPPTNPARCSSTSPVTSPAGPH
jgi:hypothetical protein